MLVSVYDKVQVLTESDKAGLFILFIHVYSQISYQNITCFIIMPCLVPSRKWHSCVKPIAVITVSATIITFKVGVRYGVNGKLFQLI